MNAGIRIGVAGRLDKAIESQLVVASRCCPGNIIARIEWCKDKGSCFAFLPRQILPERQIQRRAKNRKGTVIVLGRQQLTDCYVGVGLITSGKRIGMAWNIGCSQVTTSQPVSIKGMQGEFININSPRKERTDRQRNK